MNQDALLIKQCSEDRHYLVEGLIKNGADANAVDEHGNSSLHFCVSSKMVTLLVNSGADPNILNTSGITPYEMAIRNQHYRVAEALAACGAVIPDGGPEGGPAKHVSSGEWSHVLASGLAVGIGGAAIGTMSESSWLFAAGGAGCIFIFNKTWASQQPRLWCTDHLCSGDLWWTCLGRPVDVEFRLKVLPEVSSVQHVGMVFCGR